MSIKIILDTDIGSDIDDAVCLAYLPAQPKCELLGITTVTGEADKRAIQVLSVLHIVSGVGLRFINLKADYQLELCNRWGVGKVLQW